MPVESYVVKKILNQYFYRVLLMHKRDVYCDVCYLRHHDYTFSVYKVDTGVYADV